MTCYHYAILRYTSTCNTLFGLLRASWCYAVLTPGYVFESVIHVQEQLIYTIYSINTYTMQLWFASSWFAGMMSCRSRSPSYLRLMHKTWDCGSEDRNIFVQSWQINENRWRIPAEPFGNLKWLAWSDDKQTTMRSLGNCEEGVLQ